MLVYLDVPHNMSPSINAVIARAAFILFGGRNYQVLHKLLHALRDQVNIRRHVGQVKEPVPKKQGGGGWLSGPLAEAGVAQLRAHVDAMVCAETHKKPKAIEVPALRREPAAPHATKYAKALEVEREAKLQVLREKLQDCMADGSFKAVLRSAVFSLNQKKRVPIS